VSSTPSADSGPERRVERGDQAADPRPGIVAEIALALGRATIDIVDMGLYPSSGSHGTVALWIRGRVVAEQAERLVRELGLEVVRA
jgi:prephenate dehydrogenase